MKRKCDEMQNLIEDGWCPEDESGANQAANLHLEQCENCRRFFEDAKVEERLYSAYMKALEGAGNPDALRQKVKAALARPSQPSRSIRTWLDPAFGWAGSGWLNWAAVVVLCLTAGLAGYWGYGLRGRLTTSPGGAQESRAIGRPGPGDSAHGVTDQKDISLEGALTAVRRAEAEYVQAILLLEEIVSRKKPTMPPELVAEMERNFREIDEHIEATRRAWQSRPKDPELAGYLLAAYSKKVEMLYELSS